MHIVVNGTIPVVTASGGNSRIGKEGHDFAWEVVDMGELTIKVRSGPLGETYSVSRQDLVGRVKVEGGL